MSEIALPGQTLTATSKFLRVARVFRPRELHRCAECGTLRGTLVGSSFADPNAETNVTLTCGCGWHGFDGSAWAEGERD